MKCTLVKFPKHVILSFAEVPIRRKSGRKENEGERKENEGEERKMKEREPRGSSSSLSFVRTVYSRPTIPKPWRGKRNLCEGE